MRLRMICSWIFLATFVPVQPALSQCAGEEDKLLALDGASDDGLGIAVAASQDVVVVGASQDADNGVDSGSAYVFRRNGAVWQQEQKLLPSDGAAADRFGISVAVSGNVAVAGAYQDDDRGANSGSAYVFRYNGLTWAQEQKLVPADGAAADFCGFAVAVSGDTVVVGAYQDDDRGSNSGSVYVFHFNGSTWAQQQKLVAADGAANDLFGYAVGLSGDVAVIGSYRDDDAGTDSGSAYVFRRNGTTWTEEDKLLPSDGAASDWFGSAVAVSGGVAVVGAYKDDDRGTDSGSAYVFRFAAGVWSQERKLTAFDGAASDWFGYAVSVSGDRVVIGARLDDDFGLSSGSAYTYRFDGIGWGAGEKLTPMDGGSGDLFGSAVAVSEERVVIGAEGDDDNGSNAGAAYLFDPTESSPSITQQPLPQVVQAGQPAMFSVIAGGAGPLSYQWRKAGEALMNGGTISGATSATLTINPAGEQDEGLYDVVVSNACGSATSNAVSLTVQCATPSITVQPDDQILQIGQNANFYVSVDSSDSPTYQWRKDGAALADGGRVFGAQTAQLTITPVDYTDAGLYDVVVTNACDEAVSNAAALDFDGCFGVPVKLLAADGAASHYFGQAVAMSDEFLMAGAYRADGPQQRSGAAYVYRFDGAAWVQTQKIHPANAQPNELFGFSVALAGDVALIGANRAIGGCPGNPSCASGAAYVFRYNGSQWVEEQKLTASDGADGDQFGYAVALSGNVAAITAPYDDDAGADSGAAYVFRFNGASWNQESKLVPPGGAAGLLFSGALGVANGEILIGAPFDDDACPGDPNCNSGAVYVYRFNGSSWVFDRKIRPQVNERGHGFGARMAVSDGLAAFSAAADDACPGDPNCNSGAVYVFRYDGVDWMEEQKLVAPDASRNDAFAVPAIAGPDRIVVGAFNDDDLGADCGAAYVFHYDGAAWALERKLVAPDAAAFDRLGLALDIHADKAALGAYGADELGSLSGAVYVFDLGVGNVRPGVVREPLPTTVYAGQRATLSAGTCGRQPLSFQWYKAGVALTDGGRILGATNPTLRIADVQPEDAGGYEVTIDNAHGSAISAPVMLDLHPCVEQSAELVPLDPVIGKVYGAVVAISGDAAVIGAPGDDTYCPGDLSCFSGAAYVVRYDGTSWTQEQKLVPADLLREAVFGLSAAISGDTAVVGAPHFRYVPTGRAGAAYVYRFNGSTWVQVQKLQSDPSEPDNRFGWSVAISGDYILVGAPAADADFDTNAGVVHVFHFNGAVWEEVQALRPSDGDFYDYFGQVISMSGDVAVVGKPSDETYAYYSGAAYVFRLNGGTWTQEQKLLPDGGQAYDYFGDAVAVSGDNIVVGAPALYDTVRRGSAYIFSYNGSLWERRHKLAVTGPVVADWFGDSVDIEDGVIVVGASQADEACSGDPNCRSGSAHVFRHNGISWVEMHVLAPTDGIQGGSFGKSAAMGAGGVTLIGAGNNETSAGSGLVYVFDLSPEGSGPSILNQPGDTLVFAGEPAALTVSACGTEPFSYQWRKNGDPLTDDGRFSGATGPTLTINPTYLSDAGMYDVAISNAFGEAVSDPIDLAVQCADVEIVQQPVDAFVNQGRSATLSVTASGPGTFSYQWYKDGAVLSDGGNITGAMSAALTVNPVTPDDEGLYYVTVANLCGLTTSDPAALSVYCRGQQMVKFLAADVGVVEEFGEAVAVDGDAAIIGTPHDGDQGTWSGSAYMYRFDGAVWQLEQKLLADDGQAYYEFGTAVAIHGNVAMIGADFARGDSWYNTGAVYVYTFDGISWTQQQKLAAPDGEHGDNFGWSIALSADVAVIGADRDDDHGAESGSAYVFRRNGSTWQFEQKLTAGDGQEYDFFGQAVAVAGDRIAVGAPLNDDAAIGNAGAVYVFEYNGAAWVQSQKLRHGDQDIGDKLGHAVAIGDGVIAASAEGQDGARGAVYVFDLVGSAWAQSHKLLPADSLRGTSFGYSLSLSGPVLLAGARWDIEIGSCAGAAYAFRYDGNQWVQEHKLTAGDGANYDYLGSSAALSGDRAVVGAYGADANGTDSGAAYAYDLGANVPVITQQPMDQSVGAGGSAQFSVAASSPWALSYQWRKDGVDLADDGRLSGATAATLTITPAISADAGSYDVVVGNGCAVRISQSATLAVGSPEVPELVWVRSLAAHWTSVETTQEFYIDLDISGDPASRTSESRDSGIHVLEAQFNRDVLQASVAITGPGGPAGGGLFVLQPGDNGPASRGRFELAAPLPNQAVYTLTISASAGPGLDMTRDVCVAALVGDFNDNGQVSAVDKAELLGFVFQPITQSNARYDVQVNGSHSGTINVGDVAAWTGFFGTSVVGHPCPEGAPNPAPQLVAARSIAVHRTGPGQTAEFGIDLDLSANPALRTSEPRDAGIRILDFLFDRIVESAQVAIDGPNGSAGGGPLTIMPLPGGPGSVGRIVLSARLPDETVYTIIVTASAGPSAVLQRDICLAALVGDFNSNGTVNAADKSQLLGFVFQPITAATARYDLLSGANDSGVIDVADLSGWTGFFGHSVSGQTCP